GGGPLGNLLQSLFFALRSQGRVHRLRCNEISEVHVRLSFPDDSTPACAPQSCSFYAYGCARSAKGCLQPAPSRRQASPPPDLSDIPRGHASRYIVRGASCASLCC